MTTWTSDKLTKIGEAVRTRGRQWRLGLMLLALATVLAAAACGTSEAGHNVDVTGSGPGAAATSRNSTPGSYATAARTQTPGPAGAPAGREIEVVARDNAFEPRAIVISRGETVTIVMPNDGAAIHNWHLQGVPAPEPTTDLAPDGQTVRVTFSVDQTGTFPFICDVHPQEMTGRLTVQ